MNNYSTPPAAARKLRAGILGYAGYSGAELVRLLANHAAIEPVLLDHREAGDAAIDAGPVPCSGAAAKIERLPWKSNAAAEYGLDVVFLATPHEVSMEVAPEVLNQGARVIDLSGAFRLSEEQFRRWYGMEHLRPELLKEAAYGLPELYGEKIRTACLVANPGCYPTAANLALWPLLRQDWIDREAGVICDAKSGVSGAGKKPSAKTHFVQVTENFSAYAVLNHRHVPEVLNHSGMEESQFSFTAQLLPIERGIMATNYLRLKRPVSFDEVTELYRGAYRESSFVRIYPPGAQPELRLVNGTNFCDLHITLGGDGKRLVVISCIDNLVKGAAGQALQNLNVMYGFDEAAGLL